MMFRVHSVEVGRRTVGPWFRATAPLAGILAVGVPAVRWLEPTGELSASSHVAQLQHDADGDGLSDAQELVLQSSPSRVDTDSDGYSDSEELARGSCGFSALDTPLPAQLGLALTARGEGDSLRVVVATYFTDGTLANKQLEFGLVVGTEIITVPASQLLADSQQQVTPTLDGRGDVLLIDFELPTTTLYELGHLTLFTTLSIAGQGFVSAAAVLDLFVTPDGVIMQTSPLHGTMAGLRIGPNETGGLYQPIPPNGDYPSGWMSGRICQQTTEAVGYDNGIVTTRVTNAKCVDGWDSHCYFVECRGSVGDEYATIDPLGLVGG